VPTPEAGQIEIRDAIGNVTGHIRPNVANGNFDIIDPLEGLAQDPQGPSPH
jgi:hypothetical protein